MSRPPRAREPIKQAALGLFVRQGVHATGIREIAKTAGCSEAALYRHWSNKDDLVASLFQEHLGEVVDLLQRAIDSADGFPAKLVAACTAAFRLYDEQPLVFHFVLLVRHEQALFLSNDIRMPQDLLEDLLQPVCRDHQQAVLMSAAALGIFLQTAEYVIYGRLRGPLSAHTEEVSDSILRLLGIETPAD